MEEGWRERRAREESGRRDGEGGARGESVSALLGTYFGVCRFGESAAQQGGPSSSIKPI